MLRKVVAAIDPTRAEQTKRKIEGLERSKVLNVRKQNEEFRLAARQIKWFSSNRMAFVWDFAFAPILENAAFFPSYSNWKQLVLTSTVEPDDFVNILVGWGVSNAGAAGGLVLLLKAALEKVPENYSYHERLSKVYDREGDLDAAIDVRKAMVSIDASKAEQQKRIIVELEQQRLGERSFQKLVDGLSDPAQRRNLLALKSLLKRGMDANTMVGSYGAPLDYDLPSKLFLEQGVAIL
jgi:hypothetical protein